MKKSTRILTVLVALLMLTSAFAVSASALKIGATYYSLQNEFTMRMDNAGNPYILEVNPIPLMYPDAKQASLIFAANAAGMTYTDVVDKIIQSAINRLHLS